MNINMSMNSSMRPRQIIFIPISVPSNHVAGLYFSINSVAFHALFDSGSDCVVIPTFVARDMKMDLTYRKIGVVHRFGETFTTYRAPLGVVGLPYHPTVVMSCWRFPSWFSTTTGLPTSLVHRVYSTWCDSCQSGWGPSLIVHIQRVGAYHSMRLFWTFR
jgi:hypothetical protein